MSMIDKPEINKQINRYCFSSVIHWVNCAMTKIILAVNNVCRKLVLKF